MSDLWGDDAPESVMGTLQSYVSRLCWILDDPARLRREGPGLDREFWTEGMAMFHQYVSPWFAMLDDTKYQRSVDRVADLGISTIAGCHAPTITGRSPTGQPPAADLHC